MTETLTPGVLTPSAATGLPSAVPSDPAGRSSGPRSRRRFRPGVTLASIFVGLLVLAALHPQLFTSIDPDGADIAFTLSGPSKEHWFGTDQNGRDVYARVVHGAQLSLLIGVSASGLALLAGSLLGVLAAQGNRFVTGLVDRLLDVFLAIPGLLLVLLLIAFLGPGTRNSIFALALITTPGYARLVRGEVIRLRGATFIEAAYGLGLRRTQVVLRHLVPNALGPVLVLATISVGAAIGTGSSLSFLGLGPQPPASEWGAMLSASRGYFQVAWWTAVLPGLAITLTVLCVTVLGRQLQRHADGRTDG